MAIIIKYKQKGVFMKNFEKIKERGYIYQLTHEEEIIDLVNGEPMTFYLGIDPTADSLHIGHFFALTLFRWLQSFGHRGILVVGGATALIGDPSGKSDMRMMLTKEQVEINKKEVKELAKRFIKTDGDNPAIILDNFDWINKEGYIDFMRNVGIHFNVNRMLATEAYSKRLEQGGLTFLEMGYMLMQAYDFTYLNKEYGCKLQIGGSDQWANIVAGVELSRKLDNLDGKKVEPLFGLTCPLLMKADGEKMGKTANGTLWVSREKTTIYDFYQSFINSFDEDVERLLSFFTKMNMDDIKELCSKDIREAKKKMAFEVTKLVHNEEEALKIQLASENLFTRGISEDMPKVELSKDLINNQNILDVLVQAKIVSSKNEGRILIEQNGLALNNEKVTDINQVIKDSDLIDNYVIIKKGKKTFIKIIFV